MIWDEQPKLTEEQIIANMERLKEGIRKNVRGEPGWSAIGVFPEPPDHPNPFTYTIGLMENFNHPELIIYGCKADTAHAILACAIDLIKDGTRFEPGERYRGVMKNYEMEAREHPPGAPLNWASDYYGFDAEAVQLVWPDADGVFPDEDGFDPKFVGHQDQEIEES